MESCAPTQPPAPSHTPWKTLRVSHSCPPPTARRPGKNFNGEMIHPWVRFLRGLTRGRGAASPLEAIPAPCSLAGARRPRRAVMRVLKFGGTSVGSAERIRGVADIVCAQAADGPLVVVVSAVGGVTDELLRGAEQAAAGESVVPALARFHSVHRGVLDSLRHELGAGRAAGAEAELGALEREMENLLRGFGLLRECPPTAMALLSSLGERASCALVAPLLAARGLDARLLDPKALIRTSGPPLSASPDWPATREAFAPLREAPPGV